MAQRNTPRKKLPRQKTRQKTRQKKGEMLETDMGSDESQADARLRQDQLPRESLKGTRSAEPGGERNNRARDNSLG